MRYHLELMWTSGFLGSMLERENSISPCKLTEQNPLKDQPYAQSGIGP